MSETEIQYKRYYSKGKRLYRDGHLKESLDALMKAFEIIPSEKLQIQINKLEACLEDDQQEISGFKADENKLVINDKYYVNKINYNKLYNYQKEGVMWLFKIFESKKGCILADDMGLGKTVQVIFYLRELFESELIKTALIIMPKSLLINWEREIQAWAPSLLVLNYFGNDKEKNLRKIQHRGGIMLTTYGTITHSWEDLNKVPDFKWGILALDEGHKIKNPSSKTFKSINTLRANIRLIMTGTAVQNNLKELWALMDFAHQGTLLGSYTTFNREYEKPITDSRKKDASQSEKLYGDRISESLKKLIKPYFLRRTKEEVTKQTNNDGEQNSAPQLSYKNDIVVWIPMTAIQIDFYKKFLELDEVKILLMKTEKRSPLLELNVLKKICDHPRLLNPDQCAELGLEAADSINALRIETLASESGKMVFTVTLVAKIVDEGHKCLIFSQSKVILTIIQRTLSSANIRFLRLDGDVLKTTDRQQIVDQFNNDPKFKILLLTSQVGGVGLTLTGADRVIIYDLNWNPSVDAQAVDRVYRIGQQKNVIVYRLITCGTVEEKIYRRQIFKDSLNRQTTGVKQQDNNSYRYFTQNELFELFTLSDPHKSDTQIQLQEMHSHQRRNDEYLDDHIGWLEGQNIFGISHHDLLFSQEDERIDVDQETTDRLLANMLQAENTLVKEATSKLSGEDADLRMLMSGLSINEKKSKIKEKYLKENMFIPTKKDIKRPLFNEPVNRFYQPVLDNFVSISKTKSTFGTHIDLTDDVDEDTNEEAFITLGNEEAEEEENDLVIDDSSIHDSDEDEYDQLEREAGNNKENEYEEKRQEEDVILDDEGDETEIDSDGEENGYGEKRQEDEEEEEEKVNLNDEGDETEIDSDGEENEKSYLVDEIRRHLEDSEESEDNLNYESEEPDNKLSSSDEESELMTKRKINKARIIESDSEQSYEPRDKPCTGVENSSSAAENNKHEQEAIGTNDDQSRISEHEDDGSSTRSGPDEILEDESYDSNELLDETATSIDTHC